MPLAASVTITSTSFSLKNPWTFSAFAVIMIAYLFNGGLSMGFFSKKSTDEKQAPRNPSNVIAFRVLAIGYIGYMLVNMIKLYTEGGPEAPSLTALIAGVAVLGGGCIFLAIISYKEWKRGKEAYDAYMAELRAEAEAKRAEEEAQAALDAEEDAYYDALEAGEDAEENTEE